MYYSSLIADGNNITLSKRSGKAIFIAMDDIDEIRGSREGCQFELNDHTIFQFTINTIDQDEKFKSAFLDKVRRNISFLSGD